MKMDERNIKENQQDMIMDSFKNICSISVSSHYGVASFVNRHEIWTEYIGQHLQS
jgi:hypothetical protein